ncbi:MAG: elongation factor Ts [Patescibacteria group bacterium]
MAEITTELVKSLRDETGVSIMQCKKALEEAGGDKAKALVILRKKSADIAAKKGDRELGSGTVAAYIHAGGAVGAMVLLSCETDFVSKNEDFKKLAYDIAMQVAATGPKYARRENVTAEEMEKVREVFMKEVEGKPKDIQEKILSGKIDSYFADKILLEQPFIKDDSVTIEALIERATQKFGERIKLSHFTRLSA